MSNNIYPLFGEIVVRIDTQIDGGIQDFSMIRIKLISRQLRILALTCALLFFAASQASASLPWLNTSGTNIVDSTGKTVVLRGINAGGAFEVETWMSALNLSSGSPPINDEATLWQVLTQRFGSSQTQELQHMWRTSWFEPSDIAILASLGMNVVRIPFFYQLLQDDANPGQLVPEGVALLNALLDACAQNGVYAILDMHGAPGGQSNNFTTGQAGLNQLFSNSAYQQQTIQLWAMIAAYYQNRSEIAGYDLINEPTSAEVPQLIDLHNRIYQAIRAVDQRHIIIMEDGYKGFDAFPDPKQMGWTNVCYSMHIYHLLALSTDAFQQDIDATFPQYQKQQQAINAPLYIGETNTEGEFISRDDALTALPWYFNSFNQYGWSWTPWTYKMVLAADGTSKVWGLYTNDSPWNEADPYNDSFADLQTKFGNYSTANLQIQSDLKAEVIAALSGPAVSISQVLNAASFTPGIASGAWAAIFGTNLAQTKRVWKTSDFQGNLLPTNLDGVSVLIDNKPAYVEYVSPTQLNVLVPDDATLGNVTVAVTNSVGTASSTAEKQEFAPAFFTFPELYVAAVHANGTLIGPSGLFSTVTTTPARPGEVIMLYGTGFGPTNPPTPTNQLVAHPAQAANPIMIFIGGVQAQISFAGIVEAGLYQFNVTVPGLPDGDALVTGAVDGVNTQSNVRISVHQ